MRIGDLAQATGIAVETIRFYEREGLIPAARRADNNYRVYAAAHLDRLVFIRHCRSLDMSLNEIRTLLRLREQPRQGCEGVSLLLDEHIGHLTRRIRELRSLQKDLRALRARCDAPDTVDQCGILNGLDCAVAPEDSKRPLRQVDRAH
ncbi:MAG: Cd(II)/Pb(II)-responsive transcriptional regulator [Rhodocyclaceae bacterium]|nr:Cd(II)/Pb(II)-responsive transcriptional regulator [Rhodocyclaceae bacterium]MCA3118248.1 Cd(II)/Pb(II)-responsive transcriptional regulator [Rhodocyclaceae bacterium]MCA3124747.1 Cd(II)/Pb(II)-responsive transcriptional regulator [Rhodocyclaceae bacterium]MCA3129212.1 Cd(II)/Pb(II)-responsive transcriptional regulator [Rhodocyclaceae bacterium]MCA3140384.1 Cd(II)/Pb(II)-responsive transcriptional regulator [Rhodocyclaceae bacterium]